MSIRIIACGFLTMAATPASALWGVYFTQDQQLDAVATVSDPSAFDVFVNYPAFPWFDGDGTSLGFYAGGYLAFSGLQTNTMFPFYLQIFGDGAGLAYIEPVYECCDPPFSSHENEYSAGPAEMLRFTNTSLSSQPFAINIDYTQSATVSSSPGGYVAFGRVASAWTFEAFTDDGSASNTFGFSRQAVVSTPGKSSSYAVSFAERIAVELAPGASFILKADTYVRAFVYAAVPEPRTWALLITGFGLVGATMRRRRSLAA